MSSSVGLSPILIDLMERGIITAMAFNGATSIHDFEIALIGETSEDVGQYLQTGQFGMVEETGRLMNEAICAAADTGNGMGVGLGQKLIQLDAPYNNYSLLATGTRLGIPITVHVAIGTDIIHQHPAADGAATGQTSFTDFRLLTAIVAELGDGGVVLNLGSAVILPEVFLKALTVARNLGNSVTHFATANFDMVQHYRPLENIVRRPNRYRWEGLHFYRTSRDNDSAASGGDYQKVGIKYRKWVHVKRNRSYALQIVVARLSRLIGAGRQGFLTSPICSVSLILRSTINVQRGKATVTPVFLSSVDARCG